MDGCVFLPVGDCALTVEFTNEISEETNGKVRALSQELKEAKIPGVTEWVPTYRSVLVCYDPALVSFRRLTGKLRRLPNNLGQAAKASKRVWEIPVCYGGNFGEDIGFVASNAGLSPEEVIAIHSGVDYRIYMLGFLPGFPYLGGLDKRIHTPRLKTPRTKILPGSVGIGGEQTGIYPMPSPGGWQLIGMTPVKLYDPLREQPILYETGDFLRFVPINEAQFEEIRNQVASAAYQIKVIKEGDS